MPYSILDCLQLINDIKPSLLRLLQIRVYTFNKGRLSTFDLELAMSVSLSSVTGPSAELLDPLVQFGYGTCEIENVRLRAIAGPE